MLHTQIKREPTAFTDAGLLTPADSFRTPSVPTSIQIDLTSDEDPENSTSASTFSRGLGCKEEENPIKVTEYPSRSQSVTMRTRRQQQETHRTTGRLEARHEVNPTPIQETSGLQLVGRDVKRLVEFTETLKRIGLSTVDKFLPELVLVGDQSAGKSSLMGAIAEICLPKGQSMCTRCPTNVKTSDGVKWTCSISLQLAYVYDTVKRREPRQTFPNWRRRDETVTQLFTTINDKSELEEVLKCAQLAILNPLQDYTSFLPGRIDPSRQQRNESLWSPNVISVDITGPGLPELSFYDLPGLFQVAEDSQQQYLVGVFEKLTTEYIKHENALIICALTMQNDPGLSRTQAVIRDNKAKSRCIGVLTMPDRLVSEAGHKDYTKILNGETHVLERGYFVTKQPGPNAGIDGPDYHVHARRQEEEFFNTSYIWSSEGEWGRHRNRCGTGVIQKYLSREFAKQILKSIPDITENIHQQRHEVDNELHRLPEVPKDQVQYTVRQHLMKFAIEVQFLLEGTTRNRAVAFHSKWRRLCCQFQKSLEFMRPGCVCTAKSDIEAEVIVLDDTDEDRSSVSFSKRPLHEYNDSPSKRVKSSQTSASSRVPFTPPKQLGSFHNRASTPVVKRETPSSFHHANNNGASHQRQSARYRALTVDEYGPFLQPYLDIGSKALSIEDLHTEIENHSQPGVPESQTHNVQEQCSLSAIEPWRAPLATFLSATFDLLHDNIISLLEEIMKNHRHTSLFKRSVEIVEEFLEREKTKQREISEQFYETESTDLFTMNFEAHNRYKEEARKAIQAQRIKNRLIARDPSFGPSNPGERPKSIKDIKKAEEELGPDPYAREIEVASYIRGYYDVARLRFVDSVCGNLNSRFFRVLKKEFNGLIERELGLDKNGNAEEICLELMEGDEAMATRRTALRKQKMQLIRFEQELEALNRDINRDDGDEGEGSVSRVDRYQATVEDEDESSGTVVGSGDVGMELD